MSIFIKQTLYFRTFSCLEKMAIFVSFQIQNEAVVQAHMLITITADQGLLQTLS